MRILIAFLFCIIAVVQVPKAHAVITYGTGVRLLLSQGNVSSNTWKVLQSSTAKSLKGISISNFTVNPMEVGVAISTDTANSEIRQMIVPPAKEGEPAVYFPLFASKGTRISIRSFNSAATTGEFELNQFYN
jgi:hypothetical protein